MTIEGHVQGIARFVVGFGTEEDDKWRDYHFDFCGHIDYDPATGQAIAVRPVEESGYSLGCLQLDFGQVTEAAAPFIDSFETWQKKAPDRKPLISQPAFAITALKKNGEELAAAPQSALWRQDVEALSTYVLSPDGSDWVNQNVDNVLIGADARKKSTYNGEWTLVGIARDAESTSSFQSAQAAQNNAKMDLIRAMVMKAYNQAPGHCIDKLLPFLNTDPADSEIEAWPKQFSGAFASGVGGAVKLSGMWASLLSSTPSWSPPKWLIDLQNVIDAQALANPRKASAESGAYLAARLVFECPEWFPSFAHALATGRDYAPNGIWDTATGALKLVSETGRVHQGVMCKDKIGFFWDTAGNAFQLNDGVWSPMQIKQITHKPTILEQVDDLVQENLSLF